MRYFVGLGVTFHDPALAIVNSEGEVSLPGHGTLPPAKASLPERAG